MKVCLSIVISLGIFTTSTHSEDPCYFVKNPVKGYPNTVSLSLSHTLGECLNSCAVDSACRAASFGRSVGSYPPTGRCSYDRSSEVGAFVQHSHETTYEKIAANCSSSVGGLQLTPGSCHYDCYNQNGYVIGHSLKLTAEVNSFNGCMMECIRSPSRGECDAFSSDDNTGCMLLYATPNDLDITDDFVQNATWKTWIKRDQMCSGIRVKTTTTTQKTTSAAVTVEETISAAATIEETTSAAATIEETTSVAAHKTEITRMDTTTKPSSQCMYRVHPIQGYIEGRYHLGLMYISEGLAQCLDICATQRECAAAIHTDSGFCQNSNVTTEHIAATSFILEDGTTTYEKVDANCVGDVGKVQLQSGDIQEVAKTSVKFAKLYHTHNDKSMRGDHFLIGESVTVRSKLECASRCSMLSNCKGYDYGSSNGVTCDLLLTNYMLSSSGFQHINPEYQHFALDTVVQDEVSELRHRG